MRERIGFSETAFAEMVLWRVPVPVRGSVHEFKYRLAFVVGGDCVVRYDNEAGKGDHRHYGAHETAYPFTTPTRLLADFHPDIRRWLHANGDS